MKDGTLLPEIRRHPRAAKAGSGGGSRLRSPETGKGRDWADDADFH
jgi:hypothetical protein